MNKFIINNPITPTETFIIENKNDKSIWISRGDGEGGEFNYQMFYDWIDKFYGDNF